MLGATPLNSAKIQRISLEWPVRRQFTVEKQSQTKRVESSLVRCLDGGSSPPISTRIKYEFVPFVQKSLKSSISGAAPAHHRLKAGISIDQQNISYHFLPKKKYFTRTKNVLTYRGRKRNRNSPNPERTVSSSPKSRRSNWASLTILIPMKK